MFSSNDPKWRHLYYVSEEISRAVARSRPDNVRQLIGELTDALTSVHEAFPKELDPALDPEGYAIRRFSRALLNALESVREKIETADNLHFAGK